jgi:hypothetical protein
MAQTWQRLAHKAEEAKLLLECGRRLGITPPRSAMN